MRSFALPERLVLIAFAILLTGCATLKPASCEQFETARRKTDYATQYLRDPKKDVKPLRRGAVAMALRYELRLDTARATPCSHVTIHKELVLARRDESGAVLEETREFFTADGTRIAVKQEVLTKQLRHSGRYTAAVPLPIPKRAPAGAYHLVSTLTLKTRSANEVLAKTAASFEVITRERD